MSALADFYKTTCAARKIIVVDLGFLGDSAHLIPALWEIKRQYAQASLHTLSAPVGAEVLKLAPCVDCARAFPLGSPSPPWWRHWDVVRALRSERFDLAFNFSGSDRTVFLTALIGARWRVAHAHGRKHFWSSWLIPNWVPRRSTETPVFEQRRQVLAACGLTLAPPRWDLQIPATAVRRAELLASSGAVHFSINASAPLKEWPLLRWIELSRRLLAEQPNARIVVSGSAHPREQERLRQLVSAVNHERLTALPAGLPLSDLAAVLRRCRLHLGGDSGVLHLAMALGVPTVALFRAYPTQHGFLPCGPLHRQLLVPCECVDSKHPPCAPLAEARCLRGITPAQVMACIQPASRLETG